ncbi:MAG: hypothetical protein ACJ79A_04830 [Gemmatimonadaceae bacterium]
MKSAFGSLVAAAVLLGCTLSYAGPLAAQAIDVPFDSSHWTIDAPRAELGEHLGRQSVRLWGGSALLKDVQFQDGTIEVDVSGTTSGFAFLVFRAASANDAEDVYLRMNLSGTPDAVQYMPMFGGMGAWKLYHGPGYTASATFDPSAWTHLRVEVEGRRATVFVGADTAPTMVVSELKRGVHAGAIGVLEGTPGGQSAGVVFSNFRYTARAPVVAPVAAAPGTSAGVIRHWSLSGAIPVDSSTIDSLPTVVRTDRRGWLPVDAEANGVLNIGQYRAMAGPRSLVVARTVIRADRAELRRLSFGYSDDVAVFLNGRPLYGGRNGFRARYPSAFGLMTADDAVYLPLRAGDNELLFAVAEVFGGWGLTARLEPTATPRAHLARR